MAYLDSNWSHFKCSIDKVDHGGYGAEHIFIGYEKPLLSVHQQFSALTAMGHPWRTMDAHFTGAGSVALGQGLALLRVNVTLSQVILRCDEG